VLDARGKEVAVRVSDNGKDVVLVSMDGEMKALPEETVPKGDGRVEVSVHPVFDDAVLVLKTPTEAGLAAARALLR